MRDLTPVPAELDLGAVYLERSNAPRLLTVDEPLPPDADLFLGTALDRLGEPEGLPRLLFVAGEGVPRDGGLVAVGLARVAAARGTRVLLVDVSVREPVLAKPFPYQPEEGFADMVLWGSSFPLVQKKTRSEKLRVVCAGSPPPDPDALLEDPACDAVLGTLRGESELVIAVGALRKEDGAPSPMLRKADRILVVRDAGAPAADLGGVVPADRVALVSLEAEAGVVASSPRRPEVPPRKERERGAGEPAGAPAAELPGSRPVGHRRRVPMLRVVFLAALSIVFGIVLSTVYISRREDASRRRVETVRRAEPQRLRSAPAATGERAPGGEASLALPAPEASGPAAGAGAGEAPAPAAPGAIASEAGPGAQEAVPAGAASVAGNGSERVGGGEAGAPPASAAPGPQGAGETAQALAGASPGSEGRAAPGGNAGASLGETGEGAAPAAGAPAKRVGERDAGASAPVPERTAAERAPGPAAGERKTRGAASAGGPYSVHVESFPSMADAEKGAKRYRQSGEIVLIIEKEIPGKGIWYRVFLGRFPNSEEAADHAEEIKETFGLTYAMVMRVEP